MSWSADARIRSASTTMTASDNDQHSARLSPLPERLGCATTNSLSPSDLMISSGGFGATGHEAGSTIALARISQLPLLHWLIAAINGLLGGEELCSRGHRERCWSTDSLWQQGVMSGLKTGMGMGGGVCSRGVRMRVLQRNLYYASTGCSGPDACCLLGRCRCDRVPANELLPPGQKSRRTT